MGTRIFLSFSPSTGMWSGRYFFLLLPLPSISSIRTRFFFLPLLLHCFILGTPFFPCLLLCNSDPLSLFFFFWEAGFFFSLFVALLSWSVSPLLFFSSSPRPCYFPCPLIFLLRRNKVSFYPLFVNPLISLFFFFPSSTYLCWVLL